MQDKDKLEYILRDLRVPHSFEENIMSICCPEGTITVYFTEYGEYLDIEYENHEGVMK